MLTLPMMFTLLVFIFAGWSGSSWAGEAERALRPGDMAPDFTLPDADGNATALSGFRGRYVVLYFYPKDNTPGCTKEACDFRDKSTQFQGLQAVIIGISKDSSESHTGFSARYGLPFLLLADTEARVLKAYGVWKPNSLMGAVGLGTERTTFVIDPDGKIMRVYPKVKVDGHVQQVLEDLEAVIKSRT